MKQIKLVAAIAILTGSFWSGIRRFASEIPTVFRYAPERVVSAELESQVRDLKAKLPPGEPLLYFGNQSPPDMWHSRLWQRAFYPTRVLIFHRGEKPTSAGQGRGGNPARYAISVGNPPDDPGYARHTVLRPLPGDSYVIWFGELSP